MNTNHKRNYFLEAILDLLKSKTETPAPIPPPVRRKKRRVPPRARSGLWELNPRLKKNLPEKIESIGEK